MKKIFLIILAFISLNLSSQVLCEADSVCMGQNALYYSVDSPNIVQWDWIVPIQGTITQNNGDSVYIDWGGMGFHKIGLRVKDNQGCWSDTSWCYVDVITNTCGLLTGMNPICVNSDIQVLPIYEDPPQSGGIWSGPGIVDSTKGEFHVSIAGVGIHDIVYTNTSGRCSVECSIQIIVTPGPLLSPIYID